MPSPSRSDPHINCHYEVELDGLPAAEFLECSGLKDTTEVVELYEGGENSYVHKFIGNTKHANIVLKHGMVKDSKALWDWRQTITQYQSPRKIEGSVVLCSDDKPRTEICRWTFKNAWPCRWEGPELKGGPAALAIETLEIAHEGYKITFGQGGGGGGGGLAV